VNGVDDMHFTFLGDGWKTGASSIDRFAGRGQRDSSMCNRCMIMIDDAGPLIVKGRVRNRNC